MNVVDFNAERIARGWAPVPEAWICPVHSDVCLHPAGGGHCFKCAEEKKEVPA